MTMRQELAIKTRENLIEAAKKVISKKGFRETSIQDITEEAGVAKGTFYTYFKTKEEIIGELVSKKHIKYEDELLNKPLKDKIEYFNKELMKQIQSCGVEICRQWIVNNLKPVELDKIGYDSECIRMLLKSSLENGELKKDTPIEELVGFIINTIYGMMLNWCMTGEKYKPQKHMNTITELILYGIKPYMKGDIKMGLFGGNKESYKDKKSLVIYFSRADENYAVGYIDKGNTEYIAEYVRDITGADLFKVEPQVPYSADYNTCIQEAKQRVGNAPIKENISDISDYEVIYIMSPIYWGTYAPELETALRELDFTGKTIRIVTTHEGSGLANVPNDVKRICKGANVLSDCLAIRGADCKNARNKIESWI